MWLFVAFLAIPLIEIGLFIQVGGLIGLFPTLAIVIGTAVLGTWMIRAQGVLAMNQLRSSLNELRDPTEPLAHGAMILIAGALLLTPGFFTDTVGFALLLPPVRSGVYSYFRSRVKVDGFSMGTQPPRQNDRGGTVIDGDYTEIQDSEQTGTPGDSGWTKH
jgi:UPF0716 protein FxsA